MPIEKLNKHRITSAHFQVVGNTVVRQFVHWFRCKTSIMGNYQGGPGLLPLIKMILLHYLGAVYYWTYVRMDFPRLIKHRIRQLIGFLKPGS